MRFLIVAIALILVVGSPQAESNERQKRQACDPNSRDCTCAQGNGGCEQLCRDKPRGGVRCRCSRGYELNGDKITCSDVDECALGTHKCKATQVCANSPGSFQCSIAGEESCDVNNGGCEQRCRTNKRGFVCACRKGFDLQSDGKSCVPVEGGCAVNKGGCQHRCRQNRDGVSCLCRNGFEIQADGKSCSKSSDIVLPADPCEANNGGCDQICVLQNGDAVCECNSGFEFREGFCQQVNPCQINNGGCDQVCVNNNGIADCQCNAGLVLSNGVCQVPDPCLTNNGGCDQICVNNNGNVGCSCNQGFVFANGFCQHVIQTPSFPVEVTTHPGPVRQGCGVNTKKSLLRRIVGGKPANPKDWPWMAAILRSVGNQQFCGGALISDQHILTAAHCIISFKKGDIKVRLGEYNFDTADENNPTDFRVEEIRMHTGYDQRTQENDIAILKLGRPATFSEFIWPVCLPPPGDNFEGALGYVTGWGTIHFGGPVSNVLQEVVIPVWNQAECVAAYKENNVTDTMMCAGLKEGGKDSCQGDSGGPYLTQIFPDTKWYIAGVVSWGIECASANRPGVYTRVNKYLDWIQENSV